MNQKVRHVWMLLRNRKPIFVNGGTHKGLLIFTSEAEARGYMTKRGGDLAIEQWDIPTFLQYLSDLAPMMAQWGITWLIVNHPGETHPAVLHLPLASLTVLRTHHRTLRFSSTLHSPEEPPPSPD